MENNETSCNIVDATSFRNINSGSIEEVNQAIFKCLERLNIFSSAILLTLIYRGRSSETFSFIFCREEDLFMLHCRLRRLLVRLVKTLVPRLVNQPA